MYTQGCYNTSQLWAKLNFNKLGSNPKNQTTYTSIEDKPHNTLQTSEDTPSNQENHDLPLPMLPDDHLNIFYTYCTMEDCIKLSVAGKVLPSEILTGAIARATRSDMALFLSSLRIQAKNNPELFQKIMDLFFKHAPTAAQAKFFSAMEHKDEELITDVIMEIPRNTTDLNLTGCAWLRDHHVKKIAERLDALKSMNISQCRFISNESVIAITNKQNAINVKSLNFSKCHRLTDSALTAIANSKMFYLESLKFASCPHITDMGVEELMNSRILYLKNLNLRRCVGISSTTRDAVARILRKRTTFQIRT